MCKRVLVLIAACFYYSGLVALARRLTRCSGPHLIILNYHRATGGDLRRHLFYLRRHYRILHVEAALEELYASRKGKVQRSDRCSPLVLTFDDGYQDNYSHAFALARELEVPITIYLIPGYMEGGNQHFWWLDGKRLIDRAQVSEATIEGRVYQLDDPNEQIVLSRLIDTRARYAQSVAERETFLMLVSNALEVDRSSAQEDILSLPLTWEQVQEMEASGWVSFGAHTMHHPILAYLTDPVEVRYEIETCRTIIEQHVGHPIRSFAYPVGQNQHISQAVLEVVHQTGYDWAVTTNYGINRPHSDPFLLRRVEVDVDQHWLVVAAETAGLWGFFSRLRWLPLVRKYLTESREKQR